MLVCHVQKHYIPKYSRTHILEENPVFPPAGEILCSYLCKIPR